MGEKGPIKVFYQVVEKGELYVFAQEFFILKPSQLEFSLLHLTLVLYQLVPLRDRKKLFSKLSCFASL